MLKKITLFLILLSQISLFAQYRVYYKVGDTLKFYGAVLKNSKKVDQLYVIDSAYLQNKARIYAVNEFLLDTVSNEFKLRQKFNSPFVKASSAKEGLNTFYGINGLKTSEGIRKNSQKIGTWKYWYPNGSIKMERFYEKYKNPLSSTPQKSHIINFWNPEGIQLIKNGTGSYLDITSSGNVLKGYMTNYKKDSIWSSTRKNGKKEYLEVYDRGVLVKGTSWDKNGTEYSYNKVYVKPEFSGGKQAFVKMIRKHFKVPKYALENDIQGYMIVRFDIDKQGEVQNIKLIKKLCVPCDKAALKVVKKLTEWKPAIRRGQKVTTKYNLPLLIKFK